MQKNQAWCILQKYSYLILLLTYIFFANMLHADGFIAGTLVHTQDGLVPIENCSVGDYVFGKQKLKTYPILHTFSHSTNHCVKITIADECIHASTHQKLHVINKDGWISAGALEPSDQLLCRNGEVVVIKEIEVIEAMHKDHLEVFGKNQKWKHVADFDGTKNEKKTEQGKKEPRKPLE